MVAITHGYHELVAIFASIWRTSSEAVRHLARSMRAIPVGTCSSNLRPIRKYLDLGEGQERTSKS